MTNDDVNNGTKGIHGLARLIFKSESRKMTKENNINVYISMSNRLILQYLHSMYIFRATNRHKTECLFSIQV